jgi:Protein of unknown function (DUF4031)
MWKQGRKATAKDDMTAYVDDAIWKWQGLKWCHLLADDIDELHRFAARLGIFRTSPGAAQDQRAALRSDVVRARPRRRAGGEAVQPRGDRRGVSAGARAAVEATPAIAILNSPRRRRPRKPAAFETVRNRRHGRG